MKRRLSDSSGDHTAIARQTVAPTIEASSGSRVGSQIHRQNVGGDVYNTYHFRDSRQEPLTSDDSIENQIIKRRSYLDSLDFPQSETRHATIKAAHKQTCQWLLERSEYQDWLDPQKLTIHHGFLWIKGNPATGKSTAMKFILSKENPSKIEIVLSFFFNARGEKLEKSTEGLYRSILVQLLTKASDLQTILDKRLVSKNIPRSVWPLELLKEMIEDAVEQLTDRALSIFIDALDECDDDEVREMVRFLEDLGDLAVEAGVRLRVCLSSRHYPYITIQHGISIVLEEQDEHRRDIERFIRSELRIGNGDKAEKIRKTVVEKSSHIFLWVALVVPMLNRSYDKGQMAGMEKLLHDLPIKLEELFDSILTREGDQSRQSQEQQQMDLCLKWVLYAFRPLTLRELYFAILTGTDDGFSVTYDLEEEEEEDEEAISRFILDCSRGLVEETKAKAKTTQFIHESVREYLLGDSAFSHDKTKYSGSREGHLQQQLQQCCSQYLQKSVESTEIHEQSGYLPSAETIRAASLRQSYMTRLPFISYAVKRILYHSNAASKNGISQSSFLQAFDFESWLYYYNIFETHQAKRYEMKITLLYVLIDHDLPELAKEYLALHPYIDERGGREGFPLLAARANNSSAAITTLLSPKDTDETMISRKSPLPTAEEYQEAIKELLNNPIWDEFRAAHDRPLNFAISSGCVALAKCLIASKRCSLDVVGSLGRLGKEYGQRTPLQEAVHHGQVEIIKILLCEDLTIQPKTIHYLLCQISAAGIDDIDEISALIVQSTFRRNRMLSSAVDNVVGLDHNQSTADPEDPVSSSLPITATAAGHIHVAELLHGRDARTREEALLSGNDLALYTASRLGNSIIVAALLKLNANPDVQCGTTSALHSAVKLGHISVVEILLKAGADPNSNPLIEKLPCCLADIRDKPSLMRPFVTTRSIRFHEMHRPAWRSMTLLHEACYAGAKQIFELLVNHGARQLDYSNTGCPPVLCVATASKDSSMMRMLLEHGADPRVLMSYQGRVVTPWGLLEKIDKTWNEGFEVLHDHGVFDASEFKV